MRLSMACLVAAAGLLLAGCGIVSGIDEYEEGKGGCIGGECIDAGASDAGCSVENDPSCQSWPDVPYLAGAECESCLATNCTQALGDCAADALCEWTLAERRKCRDPDCHFLKTHPKSDDRAWDAGALPEPADSVVRNCAATSCADECKIGRSWGCTGTYSWRAPPSENASIRHRLFDGTFVAGAKVSVCGIEHLDCVPRLDTQDSDGLGAVELPVAASQGSVYLLVDHPKYLPYLNYLDGQDRRVWDASYSRSLMFPTARLNDLYKTVYDRELDPELGMAWLEITDCAGFGGDDLVVEVDVSDRGAWVPCDGCQVNYFGAKQADIDATHTTPLGFGNLVAIAWLEQQYYRFVFRDRESGAIVARARYTFRKVAGRDEVALISQQVAPLTVSEAESF